MDRPLVSIIIACWGCREYIEETILSALKQTYEPFEVVVVEDRGTDGTYEAAMSIKDERLRVFRNEVNLGQHRNKNRGFELARGELIKYLDGDDLLEPSCLERLVNAWQMAGPGVGIVFGQYTIVDHHGGHVSKPSKWGIPDGRYAGKDVLKAAMALEPGGSVFGNPTSHLIAREALESVGGFPKDHSWSGDMETFFKILVNWDAVFISESVARYRQQPNSIASTRPRAQGCRDNLEMVKRLVEFFNTSSELAARYCSPDFVRNWRVWVCGGFIMPTYVRQLRGRSREFDAVRAVFEEENLSKEMNALVRRQFVPFVLGILSRKFRMRLGLPLTRPLFRNVNLIPVTAQSAGVASPVGTA